MPINLTTFPASAAFAPLAALDAARPDGLAKEVLARGVAVGLLKGLTDGPGYLCDTYDLFAPAVSHAQQVAGGPVNSIVDRLLFLDAVAVPLGGDETDAVALLAGMVADVCAGKPLAIDAPPALPAVSPGGGTPTLFGGNGGPDDVSDLDLGSPAFGVLRHVWTRTLAVVKPEAYVEYRRLKQPGTPAAKRAAYGYAFGLLRQMIADAEKKHAHD